MSREDIIDLRALSFSWTKISRLLGVSRQTLYRRLEEYGIPSSDQTESSPAQLDETMKEITRSHPNDGEVMIQGHLRALGIRVPRFLVRASIHRVDHDNVEKRKSVTVKRRQYVTVPMKTNLHAVNEIAKLKKKLNFIKNFFL